MMNAAQQAAYRALAAYRIPAGNREMLAKKIVAALGQVPDRQRFVIDHRPRHRPHDHPGPRQDGAPSRCRRRGHRRGRRVLDKPAVNEPRPGQTYADADPRMTGRTFRVDHLEHSSRIGKDVAVCVILTDAVGAKTSRVDGITRIAVGRFTPANYRLIGEVP